jgi:putative transposase
MAETINGLYKAEVIWKQEQRHSREAVDHAMLTWSYWFNSTRLLASIGNVPPAEFEKTYYADQKGLAVGAGLN